MIRIVTIAALLAACGGKDSEQAGRAAAEIEDKAPPGKRAPRSIQEDFVGTDPQRFVFETYPLIAAKVETVRANYGSALTRSGDHGGTLHYPGAMAFPGAPDKGRDLYVDLFYNDGVVHSFEVTMRIEHEDALVAAMTKTRGAPDGVIDVGGLVWRGPPTTILERKLGVGTTNWLKISVK